MRGEPEAGLPRRVTPVGGGAGPGPRLECTCRHCILYKPLSAERRPAAAEAAARRRPPAGRASLDFGVFAFLSFSLGPAGDSGGPGLRLRVYTASLTFEYFFCTGGIQYATAVLPWRFSKPLTAARTQRGRRARHAGRRPSHARARSAVPARALWLVQPQPPWLDIR